MLSRFLLKLFSLPSALRIKISPMLNRVFFRARGIKFGHNMQIFGGLKVSAKGDICIGDDFIFINGAGMNPIGSNLQGNIFVDSGGFLRIGDDVGLSSTRIWAESGITIGNRVNVGACCLLMDTDTHQMDYHLRNKNPRDEEFKKRQDEAICRAPIVIEDDVWIGAHCLVLKGVTIGARSVIGAGSVVTKSIPPDTLAAGNPCKVIRKLEY